MMDTRQSKLPLRLKNDFDRKIIDAFRTWENMVRKISVYRNHLYYNLRCKHNHVTPPSLVLKTSMKGNSHAEKIINRAQLGLMNARITETKKKLAHFRNIRSTQDEFLFTQLPNDLYSEVGQWMSKLSDKWFYKTKERHQKKFAILQQKSKPKNRGNEPIVKVSKTEKDKLQSKWVVNASDRPLTATEESILKRGLNYAVTPSKLPVHDYVMGIESACRNLGEGTHEAAKLRADCVRIIKQAKLPKSNITQEERRALNTLAKDTNITILPADKGRAVVVMNATDYKEKAKALLGDTTTYKVLSRDPTAKYKTTLATKLREIRSAEEITDAQYRQLLPTSTVTPRFYGLPKVHKPGYPLRPIVASRGSITYPVARHLASILSPLVGKNGYALKNSQDMVATLGQCKLEEDDVLVSFDVTALFTKVPVSKSVDIIHSRLEGDTTLATRTDITAAHLRDLLRICLETTYFVYDSTVYIQVEGAAMGSPVSPIVANLFMEWFEENAIQTFMYEITIWKRYVDDTIVALDEALLEDFTAHINGIHPSIKFTREEEAERSLPMLDAMTTRSPAGELSFTVYRKPTHTDQYLQFSSNQPLSHKLGVIRTLKHRCETICSTEEGKLQELEHLKRVLSVSGYTKAAWNAASRPKPTVTTPDSTAPRKKGHVTLPFVGQMSEAIARTIRKAGVAVHLRPYNSIRQQLVHPKDKVTQEDKSGVVYHIKCGDCSASYVGETERQLKTRVKEHHKTKSSPLCEHLTKEGHSFSKEQVSVLQQEPDWFKRGVAEAIHIQRESPSLNRDQGRHKLPAIYRELLSSQSRDHLHLRSRDRS